MTQFYLCVFKNLCVNHCWLGLIADHSLDHVNCREISGSERVFLFVNERVLLCVCVWGWGGGGGGGEGGVQWRKESVIQWDNVNLLTEATRATQALVPCSRIEHPTAQEPTQTCVRTSGDSWHSQEEDGARISKTVSKVEEWAINKGRGKAKEGGQTGSSWSVCAWACVSLSTCVRADTRT